MKHLLPTIIVMVMGCDVSKVAPTKSAPVLSVPQPNAAPIRPVNDALLIDGIPRKVIVIQRHVRCRESIPDGQLVGPMLPFFRPLFVFDVSPSHGKPQFFLVGSSPRREAAMGWVDARVCVEWPTRIGKEYVPPFPLLVYSDPRALEDIISTGRTNQLPIARAVSNENQGWMPWPVAEVKHVSHEGKVFELFRLHFLGEFRAGADLASATSRKPESGRYSEDVQESIRHGSRMLTVIFVVDNTLSTTRFLEAIREAVTKIANELHRLPNKPELAIGLVLFRDYVETVKFVNSDGTRSVTKSTPPLTDLDQFLKVLPTSCAAENSEEWPEAMFDGVEEGLRLFTRGNRFDNRVLVTITDNSGHVRGHPKNPQGIALESLVQKAKQDNIKVMSLCIEGGGGPAEQKLHRQQCEQLSRGTGGECFHFGQTDDLIGTIRSLHAAESEVVIDRAATVERLVNGKSVEQLRLEAERDDEVRRFTSVMEFLKSRDIDPHGLGRGVPTYATGWVIGEVMQKRVLETKVFISRPELALLQSELIALCEGLSSDLAVQARNIGIRARLDPTTWIGGRTPEAFDVYLEKKIHIPSYRGLLRFHRHDLDSWSEARRAELRHQLRNEVIPAIGRILSDDATFRNFNEFEFGWVLEAIFP